MQDVILELVGVGKRYPGRRPMPFSRRAKDRTAVRSVSIEVRAGERLALVGESGSGKTTLARLLLDLSPPTEGKRYYRGRELGSLSRPERKRFRAECRLVFQNVGAMLNPLMKVREIVEEPMRTHTDWSPARRSRRLEEVLAEVGAEPAWCDVHPHRLSGGERRRVSLARALVVPPAVLVADEPVAGLDVVTQAEILSLLDRAARRTGGALVVISHDLKVALRLCRDVRVMYAGRIVEALGGESPAPRHPYTRALFAASRHLGSPRGRTPEATLLKAPPPDAGYPEEGCAFRARCGTYDEVPGKDRCDRERPKLAGSPFPVACHYPPEPAS